MFDASNAPITRLDISHIGDLVKLQQKIINNFKDDEQNFILHRTAADFLKALENPSTYVFGIFNGEDLVSQSILSMPQNDQKRELSEFASQYPNSEIAIYKAVLVDPQYRGHGLMQRMLDVREQAAIMNGRKLAITQIAAANPASWINALRYGMKITKADLDPEDDERVIYLQKFFKKEEQLRTDPEQSHPLHLSNDIHAYMPALFHRMQVLTSQHYAGLHWDKEKNIIEWQKIIDPTQQHQHSKSVQESQNVTKLQTTGGNYR